MSSANKPGAQPLPPCLEYFPAGSDSWKAFQACKTLESTERWLVFRVDLAHPRPEDILLGFTPACAGRVLGFALLYSPSDGGQEALTGEILRCGDDHGLLAGLAHLYVYGLIRVFCKPETETPIVSPIVSPEQSPGMPPKPGPAKLEHLLEKPSITAGDLKRLVLAREYGRCPLTGRVDYLRFSEQDTEQGALVDVLDASHIISRSFSEEFEGGSKPPRHLLMSCAETASTFNWAKSAETVIECFGGFSTHDLRSGNFNSPLNAMALSGVARTVFHEPGVWLTPLEDHGGAIVDQYKINYYDDFLFPHLRRTVTFRTHILANGKTIKPPSPQLLALHAACAQVANMSGATERLEETFRETEPIHFMTATPDAADELVHALTKAQLQRPRRPAYV